MSIHKPVIDEANLPFFAHHDMACAICHAKPAVLQIQNMTFAPCWDCQSKGWRIRKYSRTWLKVRTWFYRMAH